MPTEIVYCEATIQVPDYDISNMGTEGFLYGGWYDDWYTNRIETFNIQTNVAATNYAFLNKQLERMAISSNGVKSITAGGIWQQGSPNYDDATDTLEQMEFYTTTISYFWGTLVSTNYDQAALSNGIEGICAGGGDGWYLAVVSKIEKFNFSIEGITDYYGDLTITRENPAGASNLSVGLVFGGYSYEADPRYLDTVDHIDFASEVDATSWSNMSIHRTFASACGDYVYGYVIGGWGVSDPKYLQDIERFEFATASAATNFGDTLQEVVYRKTVSDNVSGVINGGWEKIGAENIPTQSQKFDFATGGTASIWADTGIHGQHGATSGYITPEVVNCPEEPMFTVYTNLKLSSLGFSTNMDIIDLISMEDPAELEMTNIRTEINVNPSINNTGKVIIDTMYINWNEKVSFSDNTIMVVNGLDITSNTELLEQGDNVCTVSDSDVFNFEVTLNINESENSEDYGGILFERCFVGNLSVNTIIEAE